MKKLYRVTLTEEERAQLRGIIKKQSEKSSQVRRSYILLAADENGDKQWKDSKGIEHYDYEYARQGVASIYMICQALGGVRKVLIKDNHKAKSYAQVLAHIAEDMYPNAEKITLVEDNHSAHKLSALYEIYPPERARAIAGRFEVVRTPKHGSWLNIAECKLSVLTRQGLDQRVPNKEALVEQATKWYKTRNGKCAKVNWQFTTKHARGKLENLYPAF